MVSTDDPIESMFNSIQAVKDALLPFELGLRKAAKDLENCWVVDKKEGIHIELIAGINGVSRTSKVEIFGRKKKGSCNASIISNVQCVNNNEVGKKGLFPIKNLFAIFSPKKGNVERKREVRKKGLQDENFEEDTGSCTNCLQFTPSWSFLVTGFIQAFPIPFKIVKKKMHKMGNEEKGVLSSCRHSSRLKGSGEVKLGGAKGQSCKSFKNTKGKQVSLDCFIGFIFDQLTRNIQNLDQFLLESDHKGCDGSDSPPPSPPFHFHHLKAVTSFWEVKKDDVSGFFGNLKFAKVGGLPSNAVDVSSSVNEHGEDNVSPESSEETENTSPQKMASGIFSFPLSNMERIRSNLPTVSLAELIELLPQIGRPSTDHPDKKKLFSVQDFFRYTEAEGRRFFDELDRDGDGQVTLEDLEIAMGTRKLPRRYAKEFMFRARSHLFSKSFGWEQFLSLMEQKEPTILRAYTSLCLSKSGTLQKSEVLESLKNAGLPANEENAITMMRFLNGDTEGSISYGHFRNMMLLLPSERLEDDPRSIWLEAATVVPVSPPVGIAAGSVLRSALAGGLACALSTSLLHPIDTIKTRVQASSSLSFPEIISKLPQIGVRGLYRGSIPAILGQFSSHGLRTGIFETSKLVLINFAPTLPAIQVQSIASFCSTFIGTAVRIPCEVLKQRLQAGIFDNVGVALVGTWQQDGIKGFFRGTGATLCREVPFYVAGMGLYAESKKAAERVLGRELEAWETIVVGALSGGFAAVVTTPFDVMKTRMMTAPQGQSISMSMVLLSVLRHEGPLGLFKGALPRFFWIAPLGAMNFAGYELARKAMNKKEDLVTQNKASSG